MQAAASAITADNTEPRLSVDEVVERLTVMLKDRLGDETITEADALAAIAAFSSRLPDADPTEALGPYFDTRGLRNRLGVSRQALSARVARGTLLGVESDDGSTLYPTWQFTPELTVIRGLSGTLKVLSLGGVRDGFTKAVWLNSQRTELDEMSPREWLLAGGSPVSVRELAEADIARLAA